MKKVKITLEDAKTLLTLASDLDKKGFTKEADQIDEFVKEAIAPILCALLLGSLAACTVQVENKEWGTSSKDPQPINMEFIDQKEYEGSSTLFKNPDFISRGNAIFKEACVLGAVHYAEYTNSVEYGDDTFTWKHVSGSDPFIRQAGGRVPDGTWDVTFKVAKQSSENGDCYLAITVQTYGATDGGSTHTEYN